MKAGVTATDTVLGIWLRRLMNMERKRRQHVYDVSDLMASSKRIPGSCLCHFAAQPEVWGQCRGV